MRFVRIGCAILNKSFPTLFQDQDFHEIVIKAANNFTVHENIFKTEIEQLGFIRMNVKWEKADSTSVADFPKLSWDDLRKITLGSYQLQIAAR